MTVKQVDYLNIGLMLVSAMLAFVTPFWLFLFAYAVLGPLHYLTEISWLHKRKYFTKGPNDFILLVVLCCLALLGSYFNDLVAFFHLQVPAFMVDLKNFLRQNNVGTHALYIGFLSALVMILIKDYALKAIAIAFIVFTAFLLPSGQAGSLPAYIIYFGIFLPTIIHVYVFTGAFILSGALRNRSITGLASLGVFAACTISFFLIPATAGTAPVNDYVLDSYNNPEAGFFALNYYLMKYFNLHDAPRVYDVFYSPGGIMVMRFIAFAYTYHYLNWFSKTTVIKWHQVPWRNWIVISVLWVLSLSAYAYDYTTGLKWLYFLSMLHVFLEFPLNFQSFKLIGQDFRSWVSGSGKVSVKRMQPSPTVMRKRK
jgi:hypothetical protein